MTARVYLNIPEGKSWSNDLDDFWGTRMTSEWKKPSEIGISPSTTVVSPRRGCAKWVLYGDPKRNGDSTKAILDV